MLDRVVDLYAPGGAHSPARQAIRRLSLPFEWLFAVLFALTVLAMVALLFFALAPGFGSIWLEPGNTWLLLGEDAPPANAVQFNALSPLTQFIAAAAFALLAGSLAASFFFLRALFRCYRAGEVFGAPPQRHMQRAAIALVTFAFAPAALQPLLRAVGSPDRAWFHTHSVAVLIMGAGLFVFARVIALGREIEREAKEFV
jgi:hypothetical protein